MFTVVVVELAATVADEGTVAAAGEPTVAMSDTTAPPSRAGPLSVTLSPTVLPLGVDATGVPSEFTKASPVRPTCALMVSVPETAELASIYGSHPQLG
jgi:hypothetical protein